MTSVRLAAPLRERRTSSCDLTLESRSRLRRARPVGGTGSMSVEIDEEGTAKGDYEDSSVGDQTWFSQHPEADGYHRRSVDDYDGLGCRRNAGFTHYFADRSVDVKGLLVFFRNRLGLSRIN